MDLVLAYVSIGAHVSLPWTRRVQNTFLAVVSGHNYSADRYS